MSALIASFITGVVTALLAAVGTYYTTRRNLQVQYDADLRRLRIDAYKDLWKRLDALAKYGRPQTLASDDAQALGRSLREWYFEVGGIFLSRQTRSDYFALQDAIEELAPPSTSRAFGKADDDFLRVLGSRLRTGMTRDVGTRQTFMFRGDAETPAPPRRASFRERDGHRRLMLTTTAPVGRWWPWRWRRQSGAREATIEVSPDGGAKGAVWNPDRCAFVLGADDAEVRVFLFEDGELTEGPARWRQRPGATGQPASVWLRDEDPEQPEGA